MPLRISESKRIGRFRLGLSVPLNGRGRTWVSAGTWTPFGWVRLSKPVGRTARRRAR
jgi:hypothetical protein